jgi:outer membrane protein OmpA-like peptidoglycan-associated protein
VTNSANKGDVVSEGDTDTYDLGGLVGYAEESSITDSYNLGSVSGNGDVGGLIGWSENETDINTSYNAGSVDAWDGDQDGIANGYWADSNSNVVLDTDVSAGSYTNVNQWATSEVQDASMLADLGWSIDEADATWAIDADFNDGYPYLAYEYTAGPVPVADVTFAAVNFSTKKTVALSANAQAYLTLVAEQIQSDAFDRVEVNGYTNRHTRKSVARARTAAVVAFLEDAGVSVTIDVHNNISGPGNVRNTVVVSALG